MPVPKLSRWFGIAAPAAGLAWLFAAPCSPAAAPSATPTRAPLTDAETVVAEMEPVLGRALAAYNAGNERAFLAEFASSAPGIHDPGVYRRLFGGVYKREFGTVTGKRLDRKGSVPDPDWGVLVYDAAFQKHPKARLFANFVREHGMVKLMQIRFAYTEPAVE
jgi:hypothetical protein